MHQMFIILNYYKKNVMYNIYVRKIIKPMWRKIVTCKAELKYEFGNWKWSIQLVRMHPFGILKIWLKQNVWKSRFEVKCFEHVCMWQKKKIYSIMCQDYKALRILSRNVLDRKDWNIL